MSFSLWYRTWSRPESGHRRVDDLVHVAIRRAHITQLDLLILGHPHISRLGSRSVLRKDCDEVQHTAHCAKADKSQANTVAPVEECRCIRRLEAVTCNDT